MKKLFITLMIFLPYLVYGQFGQNSFGHPAGAMADSVNHGSIAIDNVYEKTITHGIGIHNSLIMTAGKYIGIGSGLNAITFNSEGTAGGITMNFANTHNNHGLLIDWDETGSYSAMKIEGQGSNEYTFFMDGSKYGARIGGSAQSAKFYGNSDANNIDFVEIWEDHASATGATLGIRQDGSGHGLYIKDPTDTLFIVSNAGNVAIQSDSLTHNLFMGNVTGSYADAGDLVLTAASSPSLKNNIVEIEHKKFDVKSYSYNFKKEAYGWQDTTGIVDDSVKNVQKKINLKAENAAKIKHFGLMSDEWNSLLGRPDNGRVNGNELLAYMVREIFELRKEIDALKAK